MKMVFSIRTQNVALRTSFQQTFACKMGCGEAEQGRSIDFVLWVYHCPVLLQAEIKKADRSSANFRNDMGCSAGTVSGFAAA
ncbi:hypothetical protein CA13_01240 [Planctomycetes bacterium CA13]|uniref:Uncharacterized protein n=1 Tax=Novipirellula herctigrandis TaxID=2527986 RepID=A0A5C5YW21_9BACT|nr:hypothetical protein CA13_01240 [Planctomycetes bacterium CA13]